MIKTYKIFIILLILALSVLTYLGSNSYKQIRELEKNAEMVMHTLRVETEINSLFSQYALMQSEAFESKLLNTDRSILLNSQKDSVQKTFKRLHVFTGDNPRQKQNLNELSNLQSEYYKALNELNTYTSNDKDHEHFLLNNVSTLMRKIKTIKVNMLNHEG